MEQTAKAKNERHLLIVDDDSDMRLLLAEYFRRLGYQVEFARKEQTGTYYG